MSAQFWGLFAHLFYSTGSQTQIRVHATQMFFHWAITPATSETEIEQWLRVPDHPRQAWQHIPAITAHAVEVGGSSQVLIMFGVRGQPELHETLYQKQKQNKKMSDLPHELAEVCSAKSEPDSSPVRCLWLTVAQSQELKLRRNHKNRRCKCKEQKLKLRAGEGWNLATKLY